MQDVRSTSFQTMDNENSEVHHLLYECKRRKATQYKHRSEEASRDKKLDKISDYLEAFLTYADAYYNQREAYKNGHCYNTFLNPEKFFDAVYICLRGGDPKLIGGLKYLHSLVIKSYYGIQLERCLEMLKKIPDGSAEFNSHIDTINSSIKECNKKNVEAHQLFDTAKELSGDKSLDASNSLEKGMSMENGSGCSRQSTAIYRTRLKNPKVKGNK
ncbi:6756_t:CDS:2 [Diversispora eburnea]|uniref:6756_t:CDS:1 n=1 Tax=Diversispora eburnea TaxID=1213867 RepID=A0A9N9C9C4_9GLOM|nr:6756_t:CDS:2 [Diversispora eburnea]